MKDNIILFRLSIIDSYDNAWADSFTVTVAPTAANIRYDSLSLYDGHYDDANGNDDGILNKGETALLELTLRNVGTSDALDVRGTLSVDDGFVTLDSQRRTQSFYAIAAGQARASAGNYRFSVSDQCPPNHIILFRLSIIDSYDNAWADSFTVTVAPTAANIRYDSLSLYDGHYDDANGNDDGILNKGET